MRPLILMQTFDCCDVPLVIVALDVMGRRCFCTLFNHSEESGYENIGVQIVKSCLMSFVCRQLDLRGTYLHLEAENMVCHVTAKEEAIMVAKSIHQQDITEIMLPEAGYFYDASELVNDKNPPLDTNQLAVSVHGRVTFSPLVSRMGWRTFFYCNTVVS